MLEGESLTRRALYLGQVLCQGTLLLLDDPLMQVWGSEGKNRKLRKMFIA